MAGRLFILNSVADFAPGFFENTVVEGGCVLLQRQGGNFPASGSYTSPPINTEAFFSLMPTWNADAPKGTSVEVELRVAADGRWSRWFSFGRWSPYILSASPAPQEDEIARVEGEALSLAEGSAAADVVQLRATLSSEDPKQSPMLWLLGVSTNAAGKVETETPAYDRLLRVPAYSCNNRDPAISGRIAGATTLCMMMNRWGRDLLPEEVARVVYDSRTGGYNSLVFLAAAGSVYGFESYVAYAGLAALRREVWDGRSVAARVHYRAPSLPGLDDHQTLAGRALPPVLEGASTGSDGHLVVVRGFVRGDDDKEYVVMNDPLALRDEAVETQVPLSVFNKIYTGLALFLSAGPKGSGFARPQRRLATLRAQGNLLFPLLDGCPLLNGGPQPEMQPATLCYTLDEGVAYASQAQKKFHYPASDGGQALRFDRAGAAGKKLTLYLVGSAGQLFVAEKVIDREQDERPLEETPEKVAEKPPERPAENPPEKPAENT